MEVEAAKSVALIVGITGMVGLSLAEALKKPRAPGGPWAVYGTARSAKPSWFSSSLVDGYIQFDLRDYEATHRELFPLANQVSRQPVHMGALLYASDAGLLAEQQIWAATTTTAMAKNQAFNCTNGDAFTWKYLWKVLCEVFDVEFVAFNEGDKFDWVEEMKNKGKVWDAIVEENGLCKTNLEDITCFNAAKVVLNLRLQHVCSMTKSREFGFFGFACSAKSVKKWVEKMRDMNIIPKT